MWIEPSLNCCRLCKKSLEEVVAYTAVGQAFYCMPCVEHAKIGLRGAPIQMSATTYARLAKLANAADLKSTGETPVGSSPTPGTIKVKNITDQVGVIIKEGHTITRVYDRDGNLIISRESRHA